MATTIEFVAVKGARLWTARQGSGPAIALLQGGPGMWDYLGPVAACAACAEQNRGASGRGSGMVPRRIGP